METDPDHGKVLLVLGDMREQMGDLSEAKMLLSKAMEKISEGHLLARVHHGLARVFTRMGRTDEALREAETARQLCPNDPFYGGLVEYLAARVSSAESL